MTTQSSAHTTSPSGCTFWLWGNSRSMVKVTLARVRVGESLSTLKLTLPPSPQEKENDHRRSPPKFWIRTSQTFPGVFESRVILLPNRIHLRVPWWITNKTIFWFYWKENNLMNVEKLYDPDCKRGIKCGWSCSKDCSLIPVYTSILPMWCWTEHVRDYVTERRCEWSEFGLKSQAELWTVD